MPCMIPGMALPRIPFVPTKNFTRGTPDRRKYDLIVVHDMEYPEREAAAETVAQYFATTDRQVSAHYCIDADSIVQCVKLADVAWCAPGANHNGIQLEHAGYARQSIADWRDPYSTAMLDLSAELTAYLCGKFAIRRRQVSRSGLLDGQRGITTHNDVSKAFLRSSHWDPGPNFPMSWFVERVRFHSGSKPNPNEKTWPVPIPKWFWKWARWKLGESEYLHRGQRSRMPLPRPPVPDSGVPEWAHARLAALVEHRKGL